MSTGRFILIVEDNAQVADMLRRQLEREGYHCELAVDGEQALSMVKSCPPDLILLDRGLPRITGDEVARRLKSDIRSQRIPIIMLTGKADESDQLVGFALGADDYVNKPFSIKVLLARIGAQLRGKQPIYEELDAPPPAMIELDRRQPRVFIDKTAVPLTAAEYRILASLMAAGGMVLRAEQLMSMFGGKDAPPDERTLEGYVGGLQRKMGSAAACIQIVGDGEYAFCPPRAPRPMA